MGFQVLDHIADLQIRVFAKNKKELFSESLKALSRVLKGNKKLSYKKFSAEIKIGSADLANLLVDFLNEVLYLTHAKKAIFSKVNFQDFQDDKLRAILTGLGVKAGFAKDIKAATYHGVEIKKENRKYAAVLIFDI